MKKSRHRKKRQSLSKKADLLWSQAVRSKGFCEICGSRERLQAAHGFSRRYRGTRWLLINGFCLCSACHVKYTWDVLGWTAYLEKAWGQPVYDELRRKAQAITKPDFPAIIAELGG